MQHSTDDYVITIDFPKTETLYDRRVLISGWILPLKYSGIVKLRFWHDSTYHDIKYGIPRIDVANAFGDIDESIATRSGFELHFEYISGDAHIEADFGKGFEVIYRFNFHLDREAIYKKNYNPHLASNKAEHDALMEAKSHYYYEGEKSYRIKLTDDDPKVIAFYLPQFHPIEENDKAWGKGFTEWRNVTAAKPRFIGHHQPIYPQDLGYYDLRVENVIKDQIDLAKDHGIYGFCIYYYWFSGKKILDTPLNTILRNKEWDFSFMICWANENWTKRWDGKDQDVIVSQEYRDSDPLDFIKDVESTLLDNRYIKHNGKPVLAIYRPRDLKDTSGYAKTWREYFKSKHNQELHIVAVMSFTDEDPTAYGFDGGIEFVPQGIDLKAKEVFPNGDVPKNDMSTRLLDINYTGSTHDYRRIILNNSFHKYTYDFPSYKCVMPSWDNDARKKGKAAHIFYNESPDLYEKWLGKAIDSRTKEAPFTFVNAWNEWAEGTVLEPTIHYGHALLNKTADVVTHHKNNPDVSTNTTAADRIAIIVHVDNIETLEYISAKLKVIKKDARDIYITVDAINDNLKNDIKLIYPESIVHSAPSWGGDMLPYLNVVKNLHKSNKYGSILKLHTGVRRNSGDIQATHQLISTLLPNKRVIDKSIAATLSQHSIVGAKSDLTLSDLDMDRGLVRLLSTNLDYDELNKKIKTESYFSSGMYWASMDILDPIMSMYILPEDFLIDNTTLVDKTVYTLERLMQYSLLASVGKSIYQTGLLNIKPAKMKV